MRIEHWWFTLPLRLRSIFRWRRVERELAEEMQFHLDAKTEEGVALGLSEEEARYRALRALGGIEQRKEEMRAARRVHWLTDFAADVRYALRGLRRTPGTSLLVVVTLALGIGMTATPFSMLDALVFRPYPVPAPGEVVTVMGTSRDDAWEPLSYREYVDLRERAKSFEGVIASGPLTGVGFSAEASESPRVRAGMMVSGNFFRVLQVDPSVGRGLLDQEDEVPGRDAVVVLAPGFWRSEFAGDPGVIGRRVRLNGTEFTVIGVAPESFVGMQIFGRPDLYVPIAMAAVFQPEVGTRYFDDRSLRELVVRARLSARVSLDAARMEMTSLSEALALEHPASQRDRGFAVRTHREMRTRGNDLTWKFGVIFSVLALATLLVACTNVAGLLLSRATARSREIAVRLALGAGRFRLVRLLLTESAVLALLGGAGGILVGYVGIGLMQTFSIPVELPVEVPFRMDGRVLFACFSMAVLSALLCGLAPALQSTGGDLVKGLKATESGGAWRRRRPWGRSALVVAQVAISLMLLTAAFLMARSFQHTVADGFGVARDRLLMARFDPRLAQYDAAATARFYEQLTERVRHEAGVSAAALTRNPPLSLSEFGSVAFVPEGFEMPVDRDRFTVAMDVVDEGFFEAIGIPVVDGRGFLASDDAAAPRVAIVNETFAQRFWPGGEAIGRRLRLDGPQGTPVEVVGVARAVKGYRETTDAPMEFVYLPLAQNPRARMVLLVRTQGEPLAAVDGLRRLVRGLDPNLPISELRTYDDLYRYHAVEGPAVAVRLVGSLGTVALVLSIAGLYGLVAYTVSRSTREIGIRMAIGAPPSSVLRLMMGRGLTLVATGTVLGVALSVGIERLMNSMLFESGRVDVVAYLIVVPALTLAAVLAAYIPARRAARIAPTMALRYE